MERKPYLPGFLFPYYRNIWYFTSKNSIKSKEKQFIRFWETRIL
jgi:hypothetical protein